MRWGISKRRFKTKTRHWVAGLLCQRWESNPHSVRNTSLSRARLPVPPLWLAYIIKLGAGEETRTLDFLLGKQTLYQLSYTRRDAEGGI